MPFSSVLGASSVIKPGVCTSATRPTVPYEGQLIYETDTDMVAAYNGSAWVYTHSSGLVLIRTRTFSTASSVAEDSVFTSTYQNYLLIYDLTAATGTNSDLQYYFRSSGTDTTTGYVTEFQTQYAGTLTSGEVASGLIGAVHTSYPTYSQGTVNIHSPQAARAKILLVNAGWVSSLGQPRQLRFFTYNGSTTQFDGIKIFPSAGTITGTMRIYGYRN